MTKFQQQQEHEVYFVSCAVQIHFGHWPHTKAIHLHVNVNAVSCYHSRWISSDKCYMSSDLSHKLYRSLNAQNTALETANIPVLDLHQWYYYYHLQALSQSKVAPRNSLHIHNKENVMSPTHFIHSFIHSFICSVKSSSQNATVQ